MHSTAGFSQIEWHTVGFDYGLEYLTSGRLESLARLSKKLDNRIHDHLEWYGFFLHLTARK